MEGGYSQPEKKANKIYSFFCTGHVLCQIDPWAKHGASRASSTIHAKEIPADTLCRLWICAMEEVGLE